MSVSCTDQGRLSMSLLELSVRPLFNWRFPALWTEFELASFQTEKSLMHNYGINDLLTRPKALGYPCYIELIPSLTVISSSYDKPQCDVIEMTMFYCDRCQLWQAI